MGSNLSSMSLTTSWLKGSTDEGRPRAQRTFKSKCWPFGSAYSSPRFLCIFWWMWSRRRISDQLCCSRFIWSSTCRITLVSRRLDGVTAVLLERRKETKMNKQIIPSLQLECKQEARVRLEWHELFCCLFRLSSWSRAQRNSLSLDFAFQGLQSKGLRASHMRFALNVQAYITQFPISHPVIIERERESLARLLAATCCY